MNHYGAMENEIKFSLGLSVLLNKKMHTLVNLKKQSIRPNTTKLGMV